MRNYYCSTCSKLEEVTECRGCILRDYFTTDEDIEQLKCIFTHFEKEKFTRNVERIIHGGGTRVNVTSLTVQLVMMAPRFRLLKKLREETGALTIRMDALADCVNKVDELTTRLNDLNVLVHELVPPDSPAIVPGLLGDDDSSAHVSETPLDSTNDLNDAYVSDSPPSADDDITSKPRLGLFRRFGRHKSS